MNATIVDEQIPYMQERPQSLWECSLCIGELGQKIVRWDSYDASYGVMPIALHPECAGRLSSMLKDVTVLNAAGMGRRYHGERE